MMKIPFLILFLFIHFNLYAEKCFLVVEQPGNYEEQTIASLAVPLYLKASSSKPGSYTIVNVKYHTCLNASRSLRIKAGGPLNLYHRTCDGSEGQYFRATRTNGGWEIESTESGKCLHFSSANKTIKGSLQVYQSFCNGSQKNIVHFR